MAHPRADERKVSEVHSTNIKKKPTKPHPLIGRKASEFANRDALGMLDSASTTLAASPGIPVLSMISGETSANVGLDMRAARKALLEGSSGTSANATGAKLASETSEMSASSHDTGSIIGGAEMKAEKEKMSTVSYVRPVGVDAPVVKANAQIARKAKKRSQDQADSVKSEGIEPKPSAIANGSNLFHSDEQPRHKKAKTTFKDSE